MSFELALFICAFGIGLCVGWLAHRLARVIANADAEDSQLDGEV